MGTTAGSANTAGTLAPLRPLLAELGDLKRTRTADAGGSLAERLFRRSWARLVAGEDPAAVARRETALAVSAVRLGGIDRRVLERGGLGAPATTGVLTRGFDAAAHGLCGELMEGLRRALADAPVAEGEDAPPFVGALARQPRAGATRPGVARLVLEPPENHADHCALVAVYGFLISARYGADPVEPFLAGLAHHAHNAFLPDSGFAGEELLAEQLEPLVKRFTDEALRQLPGNLAGRVRQALGLAGHAGSPEARAFNAADVVDRVLQMAHHARAAAFTLDQALDELELVHEGPLKGFHEEALREAGLR